MCVCVHLLWEGADCKCMGMRGKWNWMEGREEGGMVKGKKEGDRMREGRGRM